MNNISLYIPIATALLTALTTIGTMYFKDIFFQKKKDSTSYIKEQLEKCYTPLYLKLKIHGQTPIMFDNDTPCKFVREELQEIISKHGHYLSFDLMNDYIKLIDLEISDEAGKVSYGNDASYLDETDKYDKTGIRMLRTYKYYESVREFAIKIEKEYQKNINFIQRSHAQPETVIKEKIPALEYTKDVLKVAARNLM